MSVTFDVSEVEIAQRPLPRQEFRLGFERLLCTSVEACGGSVSELVEEVSDHPFLATLRLAFDSHYPVVLRPDDVWLLLAQGLASHVKANAEELRSRFVGHEGRLKITVQRNEFVPGRADNPWPEAFGAFSDEIARVVGKKRDLIVADFSTTGPAERAASEVVLLDALQSYFRYGLVTMCGIPRVTLLGTPEDWRSIQERARYFGELGLEAWVRALEPVLEQFVQAARGNPDPAFWRSFYKFQSESGGPYVSGWVNVFFPYVRATQTGELVANQHALAWAPDFGPRTDQYPSGMLKAPFEWRYFDATIDMELFGGFAGVSQDPVTLALRPEIGWAVRPATSRAIPPVIDPATGRKVHHVILVGARGPVLDDVFEQVPRLTAANGSASSSFDVQAGDVMLRVHKGAPIGVVPAAVILAISGLDLDWETDAVGLRQLERALLDTGRLRETPIAGLWGGGGLAEKDHDAFYASIPVPVRALFRYVDAFYELEPTAVRDHLERALKRLAW